MADDLSEAKAKALRKGVKKPEKCDKCAARDAAAASPLAMLLKKLHGDTSCGCSGEAPRTAVLVHADGRQPLEEKPVNEEKKHKTSPFTLRCVAAITGGKPTSKEDLSGAFAKCNATKNKSDHNLDAEAKEREGFKARKTEFVHALNAVKSKRKKSG
jgi:hypothetical protein